jgi:hypothetical protein
MVKTKTQERVKLGDNRELRIIRLDNGYQDLIRLDTHLRDGTAYSGVVFPAAALKTVIAALAKVDARGD